VPGLRRAVFVLAIPLNLVLIGWLAVGRSLFGVIAAWGFFVMLVFGGPVLVVCLGVTTLLMYAQPRRPGRLTPAQAWWQVLCWIAMALAGLTMVDLDDTGNTGSVLLKLFGATPAAESVSGALFWISAAAGAGAWVALLIALLRGQVRRVPAAPLSSMMTSRGIGDRR